MEKGQRGEFRNLRVTGRYYVERKHRGIEFTEYHYTFAGTDGREYRYRGRYYAFSEPGCYLDFKATVGFIRGNTVFLKRPVLLPRTVAQMSLI